MSYQEHTYYLKRAIEISRESRESGNTPFGALLVDQDGNILMEQQNIEITEKNLYRTCGGNTGSKSVS